MKRNTYIVLIFQNEQDVEVGVYKTKRNTYILLIFQNEKDVEVGVL